jgi:LemA protein
MNKNQNTSSKKNSLKLSREDKIVDTGGMDRISVAPTIVAIVLLLFIIFMPIDDDCKGQECIQTYGLSFRMGIAGILIMIIGLHTRKKYRAIERVAFMLSNQPVLETDDATAGVTFAGSGVIGSDKKIISPYTNTECVYYHSITKECCGPKKSFDWVTLEDKEDFSLFYIEDKKGRIYIDIEDFVEQQSNKKTSNKSDELSIKYSNIENEIVLEELKIRDKDKKGFFTKNSKSKIRTTREETVLKEGTNVSVYGFVVEKNGKKVLRAYEQMPLIITTKSHKDFIQQFSEGYKIIHVAPIIVLFGLVMFLFSISSFVHFKLDILFFISILAGICVVGIFILYNRIVVLKNRTKDAMANIDGELKRRLDLIPNLINVVKQYAKYEQEINEIIADMRMEKVFNEKNIPKPPLRHGSKLIAIAERYPNLKSSENFLQLMEEITDTENRISYSRAFYNRTVEKYNELIMQMPYILVAKPFGIKKINFLSFDNSK